MSDSEKRIAVLIDADNTSSQYLKTIMAETANYGVATYRRSYGDWTSGNLNPWKSALIEFSITPIQQYAYTTGKNSTDSAMIIDAMDILHEDKVEGFCLVSSDSDFTRLAARLREAGKLVIGMGRQQTPQAFVNACNQFKYLDLISAAEEEKAKPASRAGRGRGEKKKAAEPQTEAPFVKSSKLLKKDIERIIEENSDDDGWIFAGTLGNFLQKADPSFDSRNYGCTKFTQLLDRLGFTTEKRTSPNAPDKSYVIYVRK